MRAKCDVVRKKGSNAYRLIKQSHNQHHVAYTQASCLFHDENDSPNGKGEEVAGGRKQLVISRTLRTAANLPKMQGGRFPNYVAVAEKPSIMYAEPEYPFFDRHGNCFP